MKNSKILWIVSLIPFVLSSIAFRFLPDKMPMHYDVAGNIDRWGSKYEIFIFPVIILGLSFMWQCMINYYDKKAAKTDDEKMKAESESNIKVLRLTAVTMALVFGIMHMISTYSSYVEAMNNATESILDFHIIVNVLWGIAIMFIGNYLPKAKRNHIIGFRTKKSLSDDTVWRKSNRFAGISLIIAGAAIVVVTLLTGGILSTGLTIAILLIATLVNIIYTVRL